MIPPMHVPLLFLVLLLAAVAGISPFRALPHIGKGMLLSGELGV